MRNRYVRLLFLMLVIVGLMACALSPTALLATATPPSTAAPTTQTPIPPTETATALPPTATPAPTATLDVVATQAGILQATQAAQEAEVKKEMTSLKLPTDQGSLAWSAKDQVLMKITDFNSARYNLLANKREFANFILKTEITWTSSSGLAGCGITFRMSSANFKTASRYDFTALRLAGLPAWDLSYYDGIGKTVDLLGKPRANRLIAEEPGATNTIVLRVNGGHFDVEANGQKLGGGDSSALKSGALAWYAWQESGETSCVFANSWIWQLP